MNPQVRILASCRKLELLPYTLLVFKTLRVGFPTADVAVFINAMHPKAAEEVERAAKEVGCEVTHRDTNHADWIEWLIKNEPGGRWLVDTDIIFFSEVESWTLNEKDYKPIMGYRIPEFYDEFSKCVTRSRLHTSLLYFDRLTLKAHMYSYEMRSRYSQFTPKINLINPVVLPLNGVSYFYDCCSLLYHAIGGQEFTPAQKDSYFHFHAGTFSDLVLPTLSNGTEVGVARAAILDNPELGRGMWRLQDEYFASKQFVQDGVDVIAPIDPKDVKEAYEWNKELCCGDESAMIFCGKWYHVVHALDDLLDSMRDGRPRMSKEQILGLFFDVAVMYNSSFFLANREILFPIVLQITNTYADSVAWESASLSHLRTIGDVLRTCGNEMFVMVALICGGHVHMRRMSMRIKDKDWRGQHDAEGNPT